MKEEHWTIMSQLVPVLEPLKVTAFLCAEKKPSSSWVFPKMFELVKVDKRQITMGVKADDDRLVTQPLKLIQCVKTRWNSVYDMFNRLNKLRRPMVAMLTDKTVTKPSHPKTLELKDEHWTMMAQLVLVLEPLKVFTALLCAEKKPWSSCIFPMMFKLVKVHLSDEKDNCDVIKLFTDDVRKSIVERMALEKPETFRHPFFIATVLGQATKAMTLFFENFRTAARNHVRTLIDLVELPDTPTVTKGSQLEKREKLDSCSAFLNFLSESNDTNTGTPEFGDAWRQEC